MQTFRVVYLPTGRLLGTVEATTGRGAKAKWTRLHGYVRWELHAVYEGAL